MHPARVVLRLCEECSARGVVTHGAHYALLARRRLERSAASLSGVCQRVSNLPTCVERPTIGVRSSPRVSGEDRRRGGEEEKKGGWQNAALWRERDAETQRETESHSTAEDCRSRAPPQHVISGQSQEGQRDYCRI